jgi:hypothetical protein
MRLPPLPDLPDVTSGRRLMLTALAVTLIVAVYLGVRDGPDLNLGYGDTDDAMRLVLARQLLHGRGWWDQKEMILQPPLGVYLHWSRLLDGGIALMQRVLAWFLSWNDAETVTRFLWPLLWIFPAVAATLLVARKLGEDTASRNWAVMIAAVVMVLHQPLYNQFHPGRIDHHNAQMAFFLLAFAGAVQTGPRLWGPALAGAATGLGLAVGLEALVFQALIGAALALRFVFADGEERRLRTYAAALAASTVAAYLIQTPPWRWSVTACDAMAFNLVAAIVIAAAGVVLAARLTRGRHAVVRCVTFGVAGAIAAGVYLGLDHNCIRGPFADVDPRVKPFWLDYVQEVAPFPRVLKRHPNDAILMAAPSVLGLLGWLWLGRRPAARRSAAWRLSGGLLMLTSAAGYAMSRSANYAFWTATPLIAAAAADLAWRCRRLGFLAPLLAGLLFMPMAAGGAAIAATKAWKSAAAAITHKPPAPADKPPDDYCFNSSSYRDLAAARPVGITVGDIDFGPFVLALTPHSTLSAPYHRMTWGIMAARGILTADSDDKGPNGAEARARRLGVRYVLECPVHKINADRVGLADNSLQATLDDDDPPAWLKLISDEDAPIQVYRVLPPAPAAPLSKAAKR